MVLITPNRVAVKSPRLKTSQLTQTATAVKVAMVKLVRADVAAVVVVAVAAIAMVSVARVQNVARVMAVARALPQTTQLELMAHQRT